MGKFKIQAVLFTKDGEKEDEHRLTQAATSSKQRKQKTHCHRKGRCRNITKPGGGTQKKRKFRFY